MYDVLIWAVVASFVLLGVAVYLTSSRPNKLLLGAETMAAGVVVVGGLVRPGRKRSIALLVLICGVALTQATTTDGAAQSVALPVLAALVLVGTSRGKRLAVGLFGAWLVGVVGLSLAYFTGEMSQLMRVNVAWTSVWYVANLLTLVLLTLWWASDKWSGAIEEARAAGATIEREEARYRSLFEQSPDGILVSDEKMGLLDANPAFCEMLGYDLAELRAMPYEALLDPDELPGFLAAKDGILANGDTWTAERRMRAKDGSLRVVELSARPQPNGTRQLTFRDVTARVVAEAEVRRMAAAIEAADDLVRIDDAAGVIQYVNPGFERATGYTADEAIGKTGASLLRSGLQPPAIYAELDAALAEGRPWQGRVDSRRKDGTTFKQDLRISPLRDPQGRTIGLVEVGRDVDHEVKLEEQLRQAAKMEAIGHLAGGVAHDFNNILTAIRGYAELVRRGLPESMERDRADLDEIIHNADRASRLTNQLLTFARRTVLEPRVLDPVDVIREMAPMLHRLLGEHIELDDAGVARHASRIKADPAQLEQVVLNLAVNARDAMPEGGRLTISTSEALIGDDEAAVHPDRRPGQFVVLTIADTGQGIPADQQRRIFEPFFTTKEPGKGTGMGLATVEGIVKMSDGWIEVASTEGNGTTFRLYFPAIAAEAAPDHRPDKPPETPRGHETVLLVEDASSVRAFGRRCLLDLGYQVLEAPGPAEARAIAGSYPASIDLLLTDVVMPGTQGPELAAQIRELRPSIRILYTSGFTQDARITQDDVTGYLPKPYSRDDLAVAIRQLLDMVPVAAPQPAEG